MKKIIFSLFILAGTIATLSSVAQVTTKANQKAAEINAAATNTSMTVSNTVNTVSTIKDVGSMLFGSKKPRATTILQIVISNISYEDTCLSILKLKIEKIKGVKDIKTAFTKDVATLSIEVKKNITPDDIWQTIPAETKSSFEMEAMNDNNISLLRKAVSNQSGDSTVSVN